MNEDDRILIQELTSSYHLQFVWYKELRDFVRKILSRLILSRGDISGLMIGLEKKQKLMEQIETERRRMADSVSKWQDLKMRLAVTDEINELNDILGKTSIAIKEFLDEEDKLKKYLEGIIKKETVSS
jgi:hypothetical protein